jgi:large subunit ribosomal protein L22
MATVIKGLSVNDAQAQLSVNAKRASEPVLKLLQSAIANAVNNAKMDVSKLIVKEIRVDGGPMLKRWLPRAQGRATPIQKKSSHITIVLEEVENTKAPRFTMAKRADRVVEAKVKKIKKAVTKTKVEKAEKVEGPKAKTEKTEKAEKATKATKEGAKRKLFQRKSI